MARPRVLVLGCLTLIVLAAAGWLGYRQFGPEDYIEDVEWRELPAYFAEEAAWHQRLAEEALEAVDAAARGEEPPQTLARQEDPAYFLDLSDLRQVDVSLYYHIPDEVQVAGFRAKVERWRYEPVRDVLLDRPQREYDPVREATLRAEGIDAGLRVRDGNEIRQCEVPPGAFFDLSVTFNRTGEDGDWRASGVLATGIDEIVARHTDFADCLAGRSSG